MKNLSTKLKIQVKQKQQNKQTYSIADTYLNINILKTVYCFIAHSKLLKNIALNRLTVPRNKSKVKIFQLIFNLFSSLNPAGNIIATPTQPAARFIKKSAKLVSIIPSIALCYVFFLSLSTPVFAGELTNQFTVSIWVNPQTSIASKALAVKDSEIRLVTDASGNPLCQIYASGAWQTAVTSSTALTLNSWAHVSCTYNKANIYVYVNGVQTGTGTQTNAVNDAATNLLTGQDDSGTYANFIGTTDQLEVYNYARTQKQVIEDMGGGHPAVLAGSSGPSSVIASAARQSGPVGYWKFDEGYGTTAHNSGSQGETLQGSLSGFASPATTTSGWTQAGKFNRGLVFDGIDDVVTLSNNNSLDLTGDFTIGLWFRVTSWGNNSYPAFISKRDTYAGMDWEFYYNVGTSEVRFLYGNSAAAQPLLNTGVNPSTGAWHYITVIRTGNNFTLYLDGISRATGTNSTAMPTGDTVRIGTLGNDAPDQGHFPGIIDEVKIYPYALTADEVKLDYNRGASQVLGALSDTNSLNTSQPNSAASEYCVPGDTTSTSCTAPVGRWDFDEGTGNSVNDKSGNNNIGTWNGTLGNQWKTGKIGKAGNFNGSDNYVTSTNAPSAAYPYTIEAWVKLNALPATYRAAVITYRIADDNYDKVLYIGTNQKPGIYVYDTTGRWVDGTTTINAGTWYHLAATIESNAVKMYVNGKLETSTAFTSSPASANNWRIGWGSTAPPDIYKQEYINGQIDNVRIFNYARSAAQVAWDYNRGAPVAHYKMDECQGATAHDSSGNSNHGTLTVGASGTQTSVGTCTGSANTAWKDGATGKFNSSLDFDGTDDYVSVSDSSSLDITNAITLSVWVRPGSTQNAYSVILSKAESGKTGYAIEQNSVGAGNNTNNFNLIYGDGSNWHVPVSVQLTANTWQHLTFVKTGTSVSAFVNGILQSGGTGGSATIAANNKSLFLSRWADDAGGRYFNGQIDDVRIFNYALTATQIKLLYNQGGAIRYGPLTGSP